MLDFIVIGAQKAGTTSLFQYLRNHPEVWLPAEKERPYFSNDAVYRLGWAAYVQGLDRDRPSGDSSPARRRGTVTPQYMAGSVFVSTGEQPEPAYDVRTVPSRIREQLPDVRLIAILRDPVERAVSHHRMEVGRGREQRSFDQAVDDLLEPGTLARARRFPRESLGYVAWGEYGRILSGYYEVFAREQLLVLFTAELERDPGECLRRIHEFLGVNPDFVPDDLGVRYGVGKFAAGFSWRRPASWFAPSSPLSPQGARRRLWRSSAARRAWNSLSQQRRRQIAGRFERIVRASARRQTAARFKQQRTLADGRADTAPSDATVRRLRQHYADDTAALAALLGVSVPWQEPVPGAQHAPDAQGAPGTPAPGRA
jgi:hypothetical protein